MKYLLFSLSLLSLSASGQIWGTRSKESILIFDSIQINPKDTIFLGRGTDRKGEFVYIFQPPNVFMSMEESSLPRRFAGKWLVIKHFKIQKEKRTGEKIVAIVNYGGLNYLVDLEPAINSGEITAINQRTFPKEGAPVAKQSLGDELKKLKDLYDTGAITKEEYDAAKKKLIGN